MPSFIGEDPRQPERLWMKMHKARYLGASSGMSGIEQACWDILGKSLGVPCRQLFGGKHHRRLRVYANGWHQRPRQPDFFAQAAAQFAEHSMHIGDGAAHPFTGRVLEPFLDEGGAHLAIAEDGAVVAFG